MKLSTFCFQAKMSAAQSRGRAVIMYGVPYQYTLSRVLRARSKTLNPKPST